MRILLVDIYNTDTVGLASQILHALADERASDRGLVVETQVFSIFRDSADSITEHIRQWRPDVVCFSCYIWNVSLIEEIVSGLECTVVVGGPQVNTVEKETLDANPGIDIVVSGEGEAVFLCLLEYFEGIRSIESIPGITTRQFGNAPAPPTDLSTIPPLFNRIFERFPDITWVSFETSRGCPMGCGYCTWGYTRRMRYYPLEYVVSELEIILQNPRIDTIYFCDSSLLFNKKRALTILDHLIESGTDKMIRYELSPNQIDSAVISRMVKLPYNEFNFGLQTINEAALAEIGRPFSRESFEQGYTRLADALVDASITVDLIYGLPGDNIVGYLDSIDYAMSLKGVSKILTNNLLVLPGSRFFRDRASYGMVLAADGSFMLEQHRTFSPEDMRSARKASFFLALLYLNEVLKDSLLALAADSQTRRVDRMLDFFESLPFKLVEGEYPDMVPGTQAAFRHRNLVLGDVLARYPEIVQAFSEYSSHRYDTDLESYEKAFVENYYRYRAYAEETVAAEAHPGA